MGQLAAATAIAGHGPDIHYGIAISEYKNDVCDGDAVPAMIRTPSLHSDSDEVDSLSSGAQSVAPAHPHPRSSPPRSIFARYWSSRPLTPAVDDGEESANDDVEVREDEAREAVATRPPTLAAGVDTPVPAPEAQRRWDDAHARPSDSRSPAKTPRRRILPALPPATALASSLLRPPCPAVPHHALRRNALSTTALLGRGPSCLRPSRYSFPALPLPSAPDGGVAPAKSVTFDAKMSVVEFAVPPDRRRGQRGWSRHFDAADEEEALCFEGR